MNFQTLTTRLKTIGEIVEPANGPKVGDSYLDLHTSSEGVIWKVMEVDWVHDTVKLKGLKGHVEWAGYYSVLNLMRKL
jgi:hypothetical protein